MGYKASTDKNMGASEQAHMETARTLAGECPVLLENDGALPISAKKIAAYGRGVRQTIKGGTGSGDVNSRFVVNIERGLMESGYEILTTDWIERNTKNYDEKKAAYTDWLNNEAEKAGCPAFLIAFGAPFKEPADLLIKPEELKAETDTAIYVISRNAGEGADRNNAEGDYLFYKEELENIRKVAEFYAKTIVVLNVGGVMDLSELKAIKGVNAILLMSQLGNIGGYVLADILSGKVNPSGKLTDTWAQKYEDYPSSSIFSHNDGDVDDEYYNEGIYVGYRYFDTYNVEPLYPFGYGLSYSDFAIKTEHVKQIEDKIIISVVVSNIGKYDGKEVVQVYCSAPGGKIDKPYQELVAFRKTGVIEAGRSRKMDIAFDIKDMASYCEDCASYVLEQGDYIVRVGNASNNTEAVATLTMPITFKTEELKNLFKKDGTWEDLKGKLHKPDFTDRKIIIDITRLHTIQGKYSAYPREELVNDIEKTITAEDVRSGKYTVEQLVAQLSVEELAELCVGTMRAGVAAVVGEASDSVPGAAGDSSPLLKKSRGIKNMILADGPAGLRLKPEFRTDLNGTLLPGGDMMGDTMEPFPEMEEGTYRSYYQYCTAIPTGWALAQAWNPRLLIEAGEVIGDEMRRFGVDLWLAPAMNIHRNPLCGRNFEYYSEDPLVSGFAAGSITIGVQSVAGKGTTIKHFACNNQEDNRNFSNSHVSERALREIYLKGFEICVKMSKPLSVMTSYNLINGVHAACNYDLIQYALRDEWKFDGVVMTDWFASQYMEFIAKSSGKYPISSPAGCVYAGNDLQMPGGQSLVDDLKAAVNEGREIVGFKINKADLQYCACNIIRVAVRM